MNISGGEMFKQPLALALQIINVLVAGIAFGFAYTTKAQIVGFIFIIAFFMMWIHNLVYISKQE
jgi:hypothetical protein